MESNFDYIVIGAGSAGCVMANRLSENDKNTVLSIEAGGKDRNFCEGPREALLVFL